MQKNELFFLSKNSLIREKIKEIEIKKYYNLDNNYPFVNKLVDRFINKLNLEYLFGSNYLQNRLKHLRNVDLFYGPFQ